MREINIEGMTPLTYDAEKDPRGDIGLTLADAIYRREGPSCFTPVGDKDYWFTVGRVVLQKIDCVTMPSHAIISRLRAIRTTGYEVQAYSSLKRNELWQTLINVRRNVKNHLARNYLDILSTIEREQCYR